MNGSKWVPEPPALVAAVIRGEGGMGYIAVVVGGRSLGDDGAFYGLGVRRTLTSGSQCWDSPTLRHVLVSLTLFGVLAVRSDLKTRYGFRARADCSTGEECVIRE